MSISPLVKTGLISYSLYLWHWPFIVFARLLWGSGQTVLSRFILLTIIFVVSWLSWRFVETPVRTQRDLFTERRLFMGAAIGAVLFVAFAFVVRNSAGAPWRFSPDALAVAESAGQPFPLDEACGDPTVAAIREGHVCTIGRADAPISFALIGDSFANALSPAVADAADRTGKRGFVLSRGGCNSLVGVDNANSGSICSDVMDAAIAKVKSTPGIEQVILISRWTAAVEGSRFGAINFSNLFIIDKQSREPSYSENRAVFARGLDRTLKALAGYKVFIVAFVPEQLTYVPQAAALRIQHGVGNFGTAREIVERRQQNTRELLAAVASQYGATVLDAMPLLCDANICRAVQDGRSLYMDDNHLSRFGALELSDLLDAAFR